VAAEGASSAGTKPVPPPAEPAKAQAAIDDVFLLYARDGVLIKHETRRLRPDIDMDILSGMLTAVQQFVKDSFRGEEGEELNEMTVGQMHILIGRGKYLILAATVTGGDIESMTVQIRKAVQDMEDHHWDQLEDWDGDMDVAKVLSPYIRKVIRGEYA
jgi:OOP family OmpA-OmpF porin